MTKTKAVPHIVTIARLSGLAVSATPRRPFNAALDVNQFCQIKVWASDEGAARQAAEALFKKDPTITYAEQSRTR